MTQEGRVPAGLKALVKKWIDEAIAGYARSGSIRNASLSVGGQYTIKGGAFIVEAADGGISVYFGGITPSLPDGTYQPGFILYREDGSLAAAMYDPDPDPAGPGDYKQFFAIYDRAGNNVLSDDTKSGQGLARPYLPFVFYSARFSDTPSVTTSGVFETLWQATAYKQNPAAYVAASSVADAGTAGEVRVLINGAPLGTTQSASSVAASHAFGPDVVAGGVWSSLTVQIQARRTSGAGSLRVFPQVGTGFQS